MYYYNHSDDDCEVDKYGFPINHKYEMTQMGRKLPKCLIANRTLKCATDDDSSTEART
jgi:hypothetical protein